MAFNLGTGFEHNLLHLEHCTETTSEMDAHRPSQPTLSYVPVELKRNACKATPDLSTLGLAEHYHS